MAKDDTQEAPVTTDPVDQPKPAKKEFPSNIPKVDAPTGAGGSKSPPLEDFKDKYVRKSDGECYALAIVLDDPLGRTHKAMNTQHYWEGTLEQFEQEFIEDGKEAGQDEHAKSKAEFDQREKDRAEREKKLAKASEK